MVPQSRAFSAKERAKVLVISDVRLYREGVAAILHATRRVDVVGAVPNPCLAPESYMPDANVVLIDVQLLRGNHLLREFELPSGVIALAFAVSEREEDIVACAKSGLFGFIAADASADDMIVAIDGALRGEFSCSPKLARILFQKFAALTNVTHFDANSRRNGGKLTGRELEIARLLDQGCSNKQIARQLNIGVATVKNHLNKIFEKLDVHRRGEAAAALRGVFNLSNERLAS